MNRKQFVLRIFGTLLGGGLILLVSMRLLSEAKVTSYSINQPIKIEEFH